MMVLVLNCGSSSLKYQLFNMEDESVWAKGLIERIGESQAVLTHSTAGKKEKTFQGEIADHGLAVQLVLKELTDPETGALDSLERLWAVGHRVLHGGQAFSDSVSITPEVIAAITSCIELGPLHNPANLKGIEACSKLMPKVPQVAVFDTGFHQTMPPASYLYGLPYEAYEKYGVRRYGFHGTSHRYVSARLAELMGERKDLRLITCHLGNGASLAAVKNGQCVDTSMGFTPLEGLVMGTRCGTIDPAIIPYLMHKTGMDASEMDDYMNKKSGLLGLSGISNDVRDIEAAAAKGHARAQIALEVYCHSVRKAIGSFAAAMGGVDALAFTAGVGENSISMRARICEGLSFLGVDLEPKQNEVRGKEQLISAEGAKVKVFVVPTNEELVIARDAVTICADLRKKEMRSIPHYAMADTFG